MASKIFGLALVPAIAPVPGADSKTVQRLSPIRPIGHWMNLLHLPIKKYLHHDDLDLIGVFSLTHRLAATSAGPIIPYNVRNTML